MNLWHGNIFFGALSVGIYDYYCLSTKQPSFTRNPPDNRPAGREPCDNPVMLEIVAQVWQAKQKRQLIFASHNAKLVVNGDEDLVAWCDYRTVGACSTRSAAPWLSSAM